MKRKQNRNANLIREDCFLPSVMTMPNAMSLSWGYEEHRDLVTSMTYKRGTSTVAAREYVYDVLSRPVSRQTTRQGSTVSDTFTYNSRSELIGATVNGKLYGYNYDNIGNRKTAQEDAEEATAYTANPLNQYTAIQQGNGEEDEADTFTPTYDADGNQTRIRTATGIWNVTYNAENRPTRFESEDGSTVVECTYDYMGRRHTRKVTVNGTVSNYLRYIYRGCLQIAAIDAVSGVFRWFLFWDPTQPTAIRKDSTWYAYGWDITKNITEIFGKAGYLRTAYTYTPYGTATADGDVTQPLTWSSEYADDELALIYYNYRHYNPTDGRWINRDPIGEEGGVNLYAFVRNAPIKLYDLIGAQVPGYDIYTTIHIINEMQDRNRISNLVAHKYCDSYLKYKNSICCKGNGRSTSDPYIQKAFKICHLFVDKYSLNGKVIKPVECVAKCLSEAESDVQNICSCEDRNARRLINHFSCYIKCGFYLFSSNSIGTPKGGWEMGFEELLPDFIGAKFIKPIKKQIKGEGEKLQKALDCNPYCAKHL